MRPKLTSRAGFTDTHNLSTRGTTTMIYNLVEFKGPIVEHETKEVLVGTVRG